MFGGYISNYDWVYWPHSGSSNTATSQVSNLIYDSNYHKIGFYVKNNNTWHYALTDTVDAGSYSSLAAALSAIINNVYNKGDIGMNPIYGTVTSTTILSGFIFKYSATRCFGILWTQPSAGSTVVGIYLVQKDNSTETRYRFTGASV